MAPTLQRHGKKTHAAHHAVHTVKHVTHAKPAGSRKPHHAHNGTTQVRHGHSRRHK